MKSGHSLATTRAQRIFVAGVSPLALLVAAGPAMAQDAKPSDDGKEIVVTGIRGSLTKASDIKRKSEVVMDSISAEDIGALPDRSVSEALQRIPGVTLQRTNQARDPARLSAEGGGVFVRGLSWVRSEFNGRDIFSANDGRGLNFEDVSADLLGGVDVVKNAQADMVEGGIGGIVNLKTRKPLDEKRNLIAISGDYNWADLRQQGFWSGNGLYSNKWKIGETELGVLLSASIGNIGNRTDSVQTGTYSSITPTTTTGNMKAGSTYYIPSSLGWRSVEWTQRRTAFDAIVQFRAAPNLTFTAEAFIAKATPHDIEHSEGAYTIPTQDASYKFNSQNVLTGGTYSNANLDLDTRVSDQNKITRDMSLKAEWRPNSHWHVTGDVQRVTSEARINDFTAYTEFGANSANRPNMTFDLSTNSPSLTTSYNNNTSLATQSNYWWAAAMDHIEHNNAGSWAEKADVEYSFDNGGLFQSLEFGLRHTDKSAMTRQTGYNWSLLSAEYWGGGTPVYLNSASPSELFSFNNFYRGSVATPGVGWFPSAALMAMGTVGAYNSFLKSTQNAGWGWTPLTDASFGSATPGSDNPLSGIYSQKEKTWAGYGMLRFEQQESPVGHFAGNIGVRVVNTRNDAIGAMVINPITATVAACTTAGNAANSAACSFVNTATKFTSGGAGANSTTYHNNYTDVLPSANLRFYLQDKMLLRLAASKAITRPSFSQLLPYTSLSFGFAGDGFSPAATNPITGVGGNPYLKPTSAWNLDASWEYYWGRSNQLSAAFFYKDIKNYIFQGVVNEAYTNNGTTVTFPVTRQMNGSHGTIKGLELDWQQFFDKLPGALSGLGVQANFTLVAATGGRNTAVNVLDTNQTKNAADQTLPLEGMSKYSFNLAGMYEKYGISARLAYNWRSRYLLTTSAANLNSPVWMEKYGQLDGSIMYQATSFLKLGVQVTNLLAAPVYMDVGGATLAPRYSWNVSDRRTAFIARARF